MKPEHIVHLPILGRPSLSGDGRFVACTVTRPDLEAGMNRTQLWGGPVDAPVARLTDGDGEGSPAVSPDGTTVAFVRADDEGRPQLHLLAVESGLVTRITSHDMGVDGPVWSPDSRSVAYTAPCVVDEKKAERAVVRITDLVFYSNAVGYMAGLAQKIFVADVAAGTTRQLTFDDSDESDLDFSPDGSRICFVSAKHDSRNNDPRLDIWTVSLAEGKVDAHTAGGWGIFTPRFSPDGTSIYFSGAALTDSGFSDGYASFGVWAVDSWGQSTPRRVSADRWNLSYVCQTIVPHGDRVYFGADIRGRVPLVAFEGSGVLSDPEVIIDGDFQVNRFDVAGPVERPVVACVVASPGCAGELCVVDGGEVRKLTGFEAELRKHASLCEPVGIESVAADGHRTEGWVFVPEGEGPHPVVLIVKGGPYTQFGYTMSGPGSFEEAQVLCEAGYLVVLGNPRGSAGYGQEHVAGVQAQLPVIASIDLLGLLHHALERFPARADRIGVQGGSFGGYMAAWLVATTDEFAGALGERGCYALDSYASSADDGVDIQHALWGDDRALWEKYSPVNYVDDINVPVLLLHSDQDRHAPIEQARRLFTEMKVRGKRAELVVFPGGSHELSRSGPTRQRLARYGVILDWWRQLLQD